MIYRAALVVRFAVRALAADGDGVEKLSLIPLRSVQFDNRSCPADVEFETNTICLAIEVQRHMMRVTTVIQKFRP